MKVSIRLTLAILISALLIPVLAACTPPVEEQGTEIPATEVPTVPGAGNELANTQWKLESFGPASSPAPVLEGADITLGFDGAGQAGGSGGCNSYGGSYQVQEGVLSIGAINSTLRACVEESLNQQEGLYFQALQSAGRFELSPERLTLYYNNGEGVLVFVRE
jgi:heat shock protein HslJ